MWFFTVDGMLSIVKHRDIEDCYLVRSRTADVLERRFHEFPLIRMENADYRYRVLVPSWQDVMVRMMAEMSSMLKLGYTDFKGGCERWGVTNHPMCNEDPDYLEALGRVWEVMRSYQDRREANYG